MLKRVARFILISTLILCFGCSSAFANGTKTQVFLANKIIEELEKNPEFIDIEGVGKMEVEPSIRNTILNNKEAFRAGAVGPDFYPSYLMGLRGIHANESGYFLEELIKNYIENPPSDAGERAKIEAFLLGMQVHYAGDAVSRKEFNGITGGDFPRIAYNIGTSDTNKILRYTAVEGYYDSILPDRGYSYDIAAPIDFVSKYMAFDGKYGGKTKRGLNYKYKYEGKSDSKVGLEIPTVLFVKYQNEVINLNNTLNANPVSGLITNVGRFDKFINGIEGSIKDWIRANEQVAVKVLEGVPTGVALTQEYKEYVDGPIENMIPARDIIKVLKYGSAVGVLDEVFGVSDAITGEVTDMVVEKLTAGLSAPTNKDLAELLMKKDGLFKDDIKTLKAKIKVAGDKGVKKAFNLSKLLLIKKSELAKLPNLAGVRGNGEWLTMETLKSWELKETITGIVLKIKTGSVNLGGTNSDIKAYVEFTDGTSKEFLLDKPGYDDFEYGDDDEYFLDFKKRIDLSKIDKIVVGISSHVDDWYLERVTIKTPGGRTLSTSYPRIELNSTSRRRMIFPDVSPKFISVRVKTKENAPWYSSESSTNGTDGDVYVRVKYGYKSFDYKLDKSMYNDFEAGDYDEYNVPVEIGFGYNYSDITDVTLYKTNGDDWKPQEAWVYVGRDEQKHTWIDRWVNRGGVSICGRIYGQDVDIVGMPRYKDVSYGYLEMIPEFFSGVYSLDRKNAIDDNFILCEVPDLKKKVYEGIVDGTFKIQSEGASSITEEESYDFKKKMSIEAYDGIYDVNTSGIGYLITGLLNKQTHGLGILPDSYFGDGIIEASIRLNGTYDGFKEGNGGFEFRISDPEKGNNNHRGYYVGLKASVNGKPGAVMIGAKNKGDYRGIKNVDANIEFGREYKLKVIARGTNFTIYLDGKQVMSAEDSAFKDGKVGVSMWRSHPYFSNIKISKVGNGEVAYDFKKDVNITSMDGKYLQDKSNEGKVVGMLGSITHGNALLDDAMFKDGTIESNIMVLPAQDGYKGNGGFSFRVTDMEKGPNNYKGYYVGISASNDGQSGAVILGSNNKGKYRDINVKKMKLIIGKEYNLRIKAYGTKFEVYLDGEFMFSATDSGNTEGQVGFSGWRSTTLYKDINVKAK